MWGGGAWGQGKGATPLAKGKGKVVTSPKATGKGKGEEAKTETRSPEYVKGLHNKIRAMYVKYNREKLPQLPALLAKYEGIEEDLLSALKDKYEATADAEEAEEEEEHTSTPSKGKGKAIGKTITPKMQAPKTSPPKAAGKGSILPKAVEQIGKNVPSKSNSGKGSIVPKAIGAPADWKSRSGAPAKTVPAIGAPAKTVLEKVSQQIGKNLPSKGGLLPNGKSNSGKGSIVPKAKVPEQIGKAVPGKGNVVPKPAGKALAPGKGGSTPPWLAMGAELVKKKLEEQQKTQAKGVGKTLKGKANASSYSSKDELLAAAQARLEQNSNPKSRLMIGRFKKEYELGDEIELALKMLDMSQLEALMNDESVKAQLPQEEDTSAYMLDVLASFDPEVQELVTGILDAENEEEEQEEMMEQTESYGDSNQQEGDEMDGCEEEVEADEGEEAYQEEAEDEAMEEAGDGEGEEGAGEEEADAVVNDEEQAQLIAEAQERIRRNKTVKSVAAIQKFKREMHLGDEIELAMKLLEPEQLDGLLAGQADLKKELAKATNKTQYMLGVLSDIDGDVERLVRGLVELDKKEPSTARSRSPRGKAAPLGMTTPRPVGRVGVSPGRPLLSRPTAVPGMGPRPASKPYSVAGKGAGMYGKR